jgi:hypothetical protein
VQSTIDQWLDAHVQHELARFGPRKLRLAIREEVAAAFLWAGETRLRDVITPEQVVGLIERIVVQLPVSAGVTTLARSMSQRVLSSRHNKSTSVQDIFPFTVFEAIVARIAALEGPRQKFIHRLVTSSVYTEQISSALFNGIKEYLLSDNMLAQKVPGLASLIKLGKFAVNKTMRPLEAAVEKTVKAYIETNLGNTIRRSEQSINEHFNAARIAQMGKHVWDQMAARKLAEFMRILDAADLDDLVGIGLQFWQDFRKTPYFRAIAADQVRYFFEAYGDTPLSLVAADLGISEKLVFEELLHGAGQGVQTALASGFLEQRIRARLEDFYRSPQAARLVAGGAGSTPAKAGKAVKAAPTARKPSPRRSADSGAPAVAAQPVRRRRSA